MIEYIDDMKGSKMIVSLDVRFSRQFKIRYWVAMKLFALAAWVINIDLDLETHE